jgi:KaiC/GvpD/RAD55 family RecA-like ATPase
VITDPRLECLLGHLPSQPAADPTASLQAAAEMLADLGPSIEPGEARMILGGVVSAWGMTVDQSRVDAAAIWCSGLAATRTADRAAGDPLESHLRDQSKGRYALTPWPWPGLTDASRSLMPGSVTLVCGTPGASKSWFALTCIRYWTEHGVGSAVLMLEETVKWHMQRALAQCVGDPNLLYPEWIKANYETATAIWEQHRDELAVVRSHLTCEGDWTLAKCADWVEQQCKAGRRVIIIDPISLADPGSEKSWDADRKFMARAKVAIERSGTSLVLITHPRKASVGKQSGPPTLDDLAGGAAFGRACASALWVTGVDGHDEVPVITSDGSYVQAVPHKVIRILKARNSTGTGKGMAYSFTNLRFDELGELAGKHTEHRPINSAGPSRAAKLKASPSPEEDQFA